MLDELHCGHSCLLYGPIDQSSESPIQIPLGVVQLKDGCHRSQVALLLCSPEGNRNTCMISHDAFEAQEDTGLNICSPKCYIRAFVRAKLMPTLSTFPDPP